MPQSSGAQTVTNQTKLPDWYTKRAKEALTKSVQVSKNLDKPYQGNTVARLNPTQHDAIDRLRDNVGSTNAGYRQAMRGTREVMNYDPTMIGDNYDYLGVDGGSFLNGNLQNYLNPYLAEVEANAMRNLDDQRLKAQNGNYDAAVRSGALGGSRHGVVEAVTNSEAAKAAGDLSANIRSTGYGQAADMMGQDLARQLQAGMANQNAWYNDALMAYQGDLANQQAGLQGKQLNLAAAGQLGQLTADKQAAYLQGIQGELTGGNMLQAQRQAILDMQEEQYNAMRMYPLEKLNIRLAALSGTQLPTTTTQTSPTTGNPYLGAMGGAMTGASMGSMFGPWGTGIGAVGGGLFGYFSDERAKTNVEPLGRDAFTGIPVYAYDYKSDVQQARHNGSPMPPKRVGPMAQDIERVQPDRVRQIGGKKVVSNLGFGSF